MLEAESRAARPAGDGPRNGRRKKASSDLLG